MKKTKIIYQPFPKRYQEFSTIKELIHGLPYKRYFKISSLLGRGITLEPFGEDCKEFIVIPYASRNRVLRLLQSKLLN